MRRITTLLALVAVCSLGISVAQACPKSCDKKASAQKTTLTKSACSAKQACASSDQFPTLVQLVGDKKVGCPIEAAKLAKENGKKIIYVVGSKTFESRQAAATAWAEASENYAKRFLTIACVVDGKVMSCDQPCGDAPGCSSAKTKLSKANAKGCCKAGAAKAKLAKADGKSCCKAKKANLAGADGKTCPHPVPLTKLASADGKGCCKAKAAKAKLAKADGKTCSKAGAAKAKAGGKSCCKAAKAKLAKTDGKDSKKTCPFEAAKLAKADGKTCSKAGAAKAKADGKSCCKAAKAKLAKADGKDCKKTCPLQAAKLAKADGKTCRKASARRTKIVSSKGKSCCKASKTKLAKTDGKDCSKTCTKATKLAKSGYHAGYEAGYAAGYATAKKDSLVMFHGQSWSRQGKTVKYRVVGRNFDTWADAVKARDQATAAAKTVSMKYIVDGKEVACASQVCPKAKAAGKVVYVVSGEKMECQYRARAALAKAKCQAAKKACTKLLAKM